MTPLRTLALPALVLLLALGLRLYGIDNQSLWYDEGLTVALAQRSPAQIARDAAADVHPPLYYWALHAWSGVLGTSVPAVRSLSALCGALAAALTAVLARRWFGAGAGWLAGLAAAVSPIGVHYGQETRMYALAALVATLMWYALDRWVAAGAGAGGRDAGRPAVWLAAYGLAALAAIFTHYFMVTVVAATCLAGIVRVLASRRATLSDHPPALPWLALHLALAAAYLPLAWGSRERLAGWTFAKEPTDPIFILGDALRQFSIGPSAGDASPLWLVAFALALTAGLLLPLLTARPPELPSASSQPVMLPALWLVVPLAAIILLSLGQPYYKPRFMLPALPAFHILVGAGAAGLAARLAAVLPGASRHPWSSACCLVPFALCLLLAAAGPLANEYTDPRFWRDDYRGAARAIEATAAPGDAVLLVGPGQAEVLDYYLRLPLARYPLPRVRPLDPAAVTAELDRMAGSHRRVYAVLYVPYEADPEGVIDGWLRARAFPAGARWYGGVKLAVYELGDLGAAMRPLGARFDGGVTLARLAVSEAAVRPGDAVRVQAEWVAETPPGRPLALFAHLLDARGAIVAQFDGPPAGADTATWQVGEPHLGRFAVVIPREAPPGPYRLVAGLYDPTSGERLAVRGADALPLAEVRVTP